MEITYTLIVALMYVTILSFGLASLLTSLSSIIQKDNKKKISNLHLNWILIVLFLHFNMTWHAVYLANVKSWTYFGFIIIILGPILGFFTANILSPTFAETITQEKLEQKFIKLKSQILSLFILIQSWILITDWVLDRGFVQSAWFNWILILLSIVLFKSNSFKLQRIGVVLIWVLLILGIILRAYNIIE